MAVLVWNGVLEELIFSIVLIKCLIEMAGVHVDEIASAAHPLVARMKLPECLSAVLSTGCWELSLQC